jgi:glycosidase
MESESEFMGWKGRVTYEIFVQSFCDSNGDGVGDLQGVISRLDYIKSLGAGAIWLMPIHPSSTYHKYEVDDYYEVDPDFGSLEDFRMLIKEAHQRDIRVLIDLVINHTSWDHPWFREAIKDPQSPYYSYYVWEDLRKVKNEISSRDRSYDTDQLSQWHKVEGSDKHYYGFFYKTMPDLNFDNPRVRDEIENVGKFWIEQGVDGFRLDAAKYIYREHEMDKTLEFWRDFGKRMRSHKADIFLIGEVWADRNTIAPFHQGLDACFNFDLSFLIVDILKENDSTADLIETFLETERLYEVENSDFINATFLKNHDQNRLLSELNGHVQKARQAAAILFSLPGSPYVYYGEELGMSGEKPDEFIREPVIWGEDDPMNPTWMDPKYSRSGDFPSVEAQENDPGSMLNYYRKLIKVRNSNAPLTDGVLIPVDTANNSVISFKRIKGDETILIYHVVGEGVSITPPKYRKILFSTGEFSKSETGFRLEQNSSLYLLI